MIIKNWEFVGLQIVKKATKEPDGDLAWDVVNLCFRKGLMMFAPVGFGGGCVKIAPPLCITEDAVREACDVIRQAFTLALAGAGTHQQAVEKTS